MRVVYSTTFQLCFVRTEKSLMKKKEDLPIYCPLNQSTTILELANRSYSPFCSVSVDTF